MNVSDPQNATNQPPSLPDQSQVITIKLPIAKPWVAYSLLGITITIYLLQMLSQAVFQGIDYPAALGAKINAAIQAGQFWRLITPMLLHGSILHIGFNMYALYVIGPGLERYYGHKRFLALYLLSAFTGNVASFVLSSAASLGASTAIFGLVTAEGIFIYKNRFLFGKKAQSMLINIGSIVVINLLLGLNPGIDNWGHLGGLIGGLAFSWFSGPAYKIGGLPPEYQLEDQVPPERGWQTALAVALVFVVIVIMTINLR